MQGNADPEVCSECCRKDFLIEKYLNLIALLEMPKAQIEHSSSPRKIRKRTSREQSNKEKIFMDSLHRLHVCKLRKAFELIYFSGRSASPRRIQKITEYFRSFGFKQLSYSFHRILGFSVGNCHCMPIVPINQNSKYTLHLPSLQSSVNSCKISINSCKTNQNSCKTSDNSCKMSSKHSSEQLPPFSVIRKSKMISLSKQLFELLEDNLRLRCSNTRLEQELKESARRQQIQNKKKKDSLQMLAQDLAEKNDLIEELQLVVRSYEEKHNNNANILEQNCATLHKEMERLEKINDKINNEIDRKNSLIAQLEKDYSVLKGENENLLKLNASLKAQGFEVCLSQVQVQKLREENTRMNAFFEKKILEVRKYQSRLNHFLRQPEKLAGDRENNQFANDLRGHFKSEQILNFLYDIDSELNEEDKRLKLFDADEARVLIDIKKKYHALLEQTNKANRDQNNCSDKLQIKDSIQQKKSGNNQMFDCFSNFNGGSQYVDSPKDGLPESPSKKDHCSKISSIGNHRSNEAGSSLASNRRKCRDPECNGQDYRNKESISEQLQQTSKRQHSVTIKLLEMQMNRNKQLDKISELKNQLFCVRNIVMNLLKSLDLKNIKQETKGILDLLFDFFQYSEDEKETIFNSRRKEKKGFFGFM